jgi:hypothetical protein
MFLLALDSLFFGFTLWLGLYLINRDFSNTHLRFAGLGLLSFALGWGCSILKSYAPTPAFATTLANISWPLFVFPSLFWTGALIYLLSEDMPFRTHLTSLWSYGLFPVATLCLLLSVATNLFFHFTNIAPRAGFTSFILSTLSLIPLLVVLFLTWQSLRSLQPMGAVVVLVASLLFLLLVTALFLLPLEGLLSNWLLLLLGIDLLSLGCTAAIVDAFDQGEALIPDIFRSFDFSFGTVLLFGGQVVIVMILATGVTFPMLVLLLAIIATSIAMQTFSHTFGELLEKLAFAQFPQLRKASAELRTAATILPRVNQALNFQQLDEVEFARYTRRALRHFGDLSHLATNPLTFLPLIERRLAKRGTNIDAIGRAVELKALLTESITRLKPQNGNDFGTSAEWRYYNAVYFPYNVGLKPYSRRTQHINLDPAAKQALEWFRIQVPERTLHNWQTAATKLVAQDLRDKQSLEQSSRV